MVLQQFPQSGGRPSQPRLDSSEGQRELGGDIGVRLVFVEIELQEVPKIRRQLRQRPSDMLFSLASTQGFVARAFEAGYRLQIGIVQHRP